MAWGPSSKCDICRKKSDPLFEVQGKTVCFDCKGDLQGLAAPVENASGYRGDGGKVTKPMGHNPNQRLSKRAQKENEEWLKKHGKK